MSPSSRFKIMVFLKYPEPGKVKTRLGSVLGLDWAARLYRCFVSDIVTQLQTLACDVEIWRDNETYSVVSYQQWLGVDWPIYTQDSGDLGQRLASCFDQVFLDETVGSAMVMGSDSPDLPVRYLQNGAKYLDRFPAVVGPAEDGGYYAIGFRRESFSRVVFEEISWSTDQVYSQTMDRFMRLGQDVAVLEPWCDVDTFADLRELVRRIDGAKSLGFERSHTWRFLQQDPELLRDLRYDEEHDATG